MNRSLEILHVDDDPQVARIVAARLNLRGYRVTSLTAPERAVEVLAERNFRIVLLDIDMPGIDGIELLTRIKAHDGGIQVIMLTGLVTMSSVLQSFRRGAEACFFKPLDDVEPLLAALADVEAKLQRWWTTLDRLQRLKKRPAAVC